MQKLVACLGAAAVVVLCASQASAQQATLLKPYVELILDTSGSMVDTAQGNPTGSGPPSCGGTDNKLNHAKCAIENIANSYGDIEFGFGRFRNITSGTPTGAFTDTGTADTLPGCCSPGPDAKAGGGCPAGVKCTANDDMFELLNPLTDDIGVGTAKWVNDSANTCTAVGTDPEVWNADSNTPLEGVLKGVKRYWQGLQATATTITASPGGATEAGTTATYTTSANHNLTAGEPILVAGVGVAGYNGTFIVNTVPSGTTFTVAGLAAGLANSGGGSVAVVIFQGTPAQGFSPIVNDPTKTIFLPNGCDPTPTCTVHTPAQVGDCCNTQCRPYITILLTDGAETCGGTPANGAAALLTTQVGADDYRIETKPIGFGITPPAVNACTAPGQAGCQIEDIAHAGGAPDVAGKLEGFYANDQAGVEAAISQIIEGSVRSEICNKQDDDCDGKIDEGFDVGALCNNGLQGVCLINGSDQCRADGAGVVCDAGASACAAKAPGAACNVNNAAGASVAGTCQNGDCVPTPGVEICNGLDDDCDGKIDEDTTGCGCIPQAEICDGKDNDCDGNIDEDTDVPCGVNLGVCTTGVEHCVCAGSNCGLGACTGKQPCNGVTPCVDVCNGLDDDCDGVADGITQACSNLPPNGHPAGDPANNPGDPGQGTLCDAEGLKCACHPGTENCPANGSGKFSSCTGEVGPTAELCDGIDNDCDGTIDEDFASAKCGACGGMTACVNGQVICTAGAGSAEICNGQDDDCDGNIDEDIPTGSACGSGSVCNGVLTCVGGSFQCLGTPVNQESCNCMDDDCDGTVDEDNGNCPTGSTCTKTAATCECAFPCGGSEFPCPAGKICDSQSQLCITDVCFGVNCGADGSGNAQVCSQATGTCVSACSVTDCGSGGEQVCVPQTGMCAPNNCVTFPQMCTGAQNCVNGTCQSNPCSGVTCPTDQYCVAGNCVASCAGVTCPMSQECVLGQCTQDPCGAPCPNGQVCHSDGTCGANACQFANCPQGQACDPSDGTCKTDPCLGTTCPGSGEVCVGGTCYDPTQLAPDAATEIHVSAAGGGGCDVGGGGGSALVLGAIGLALSRRRRTVAKVGGAL